MGNETRHGEGRIAIKKLRFAGSPARRKHFLGVTPTISFILARGSFHWSLDHSLAITPLLLYHAAAATDLDEAILWASNFIKYQSIPVTGQNSMMIV